MNRPPLPTPRPRRRAAGFTLTEVLIALGVFALGFVAVASIFPVAILMQKATISQTEGRTFGRNLQATLGALGLEVNGTTDRWVNLEVDAATLKNDPNRVQTLPDSVLDRLNIADFSYGSADALDFRRQFAIPLIVDIDDSAAGTATGGSITGQQWVLHLFIVARNGDRAGRYPKPATDAADNWAEVPGFEQQGRPGFPGPPRPLIDGVLGYDDIPGVFKQPVTRGASNELRFTNTDASGRLKVRIGERVLDNLGSTYRVTEAFTDRIVINGAAPTTVSHIWIADPGDTGQSSFVRLVSLPLDFFDPDGSGPAAPDPDLLILQDTTSP